MHILIVEDDAKVAEFVSEGFRREGHAVTLARDGEEGLAAARNGDYAAAVMDIMLPKMDGLEIIRRLRAVGSKLPVIILSARGSVEAKIEGLEAGADDWTEYVCGTDPNNTDDRQRCTISVVDGSPVVGYEPRDGYLSGYRAVLKGKASLSDAPWTDVTPQHRFFKVFVEKK